MDKSDAARRIEELLTREREEFLLICRLTDEMVSAGAQEITELSEQRGEAIKRAGNLRKSALEACGDDRQLVDALKLGGDPEKDDARARRVRDLSLGIHSLWNRIVNNESAVSERLEFLKRDIIESLEDLNSGSARFAGRYSDSVKTGLGDSARGADKSRYI